MNFVKLYIGDYLRDTGTLTLAQHGAYTLMLLEHYATEKPLPTGRELHRLLRADSKAEREAIDFVASRYWQTVDGGLSNARAIKEIERASHQRSINQEIGKRGGRPKRTETVTESVSETEANRNPNQTPDTRHQTETGVFESVFRAHDQDPPSYDPEDGEFTHTDSIADPETPSRYGAISRALRQAGISNAQPALMRFRLLVDAGADAAEFLAFVPKAMGIQGDRFAYICGSVEGERKRAAATAGQLHVGTMPMSAKAAENAKWIAGTSLDRSTKRNNVIDMEAGNVAPLVLGR